MFKLKGRDFLKGLIMAVGTPVLYLLQELIPEWNIPPLAKAAISAAITYLIKNLFTDDVKVAEKVLKEDNIKKSSIMDNQFIKDTITNDWLSYQTGTDTIVWVSSQALAYMFTTQPAMDAQLAALNTPQEPNRFIGAGGVGTPK